LPCLSTLSNSSGPLLSDAIFAIADLCRAEVLDVSAVLKQLEVRMQQPDSEPALVAYCDLLATSAADPDQEDVLNKCIRKLWALKGHPTEIVRAAAWKALSSFQLTSVKTALDSAQESLFSNWIQSLNRASEYLQQRKVSEEFGRFMHKMVACELDDFGRSLYTTVEGTSRLDPILETACHLRDMINKASGVAQLCLLGAASSAIQLPTKRSSSTMQHLYRLFVQVSAPTEDDWRPVMRYFAAWRMAVGWAYEILSRARQTHPGRDPPPNWARDQICETMKRALSQNQKAQLNVVVALAFVAERSEFDRSWMVSTLEYLLTCCSSDHTCRSPLLFQQKISYNQEWYSITRLATALFCTKLDSETLSSFVNLSEELWSSTERHLIDQWARSIMSGSGEVEDEGISCVTSYLLRFSSWNVELIDSLCSRSEATAIGYMVGADPVMIGCLVDQMRLDASAEERFLELISKDHLERIDVEAIFESFSNMSSDSRQMHAAVLARKAEKVVKDNCDDMAIVNAVIEGEHFCALEIVFVK
uniref:SpoU_methylase domain-containing protein n=1 Tax=Toxocara canis TaxID=6265 RepID=A0A183VCS6_TOXCA